MTLESHASELPVPLGSVIAGKYRVERVLGVGGMGVVAVGRHLQLQQKVAIKVLRPAALADREIVTRFGREARAVSNIKSEHVARVLDVGELAGGIPYMVMEYLEGSDLGKIAKERGALPAGEAVDYVLQACEALAEAHRAGIVHRDLKPANLFLTQRADATPLVKVLDFGISKLGQFAIDSEELTQSEMIMGSPHYMSPEQMRTPKSVDTRADIWALGAILYKLVTGHTPFRGASTAELCVQLLTQTAPRISARCPDVPPALDEAVARCMTTDLALRFGTIAELATALESVASEEGHSSIRAIIRVSNARASAPSVPPPPAPDRTIHQRAEDPRRAPPPADAESIHENFGASTVAPLKSGTRRLWGMIAVAGVIVLGLGAWKTIPRGAPAPSAPQMGLVSPPPPAAANLPLPAREADPPAADLSPPKASAAASVTSAPSASAKVAPAVGVVRRGAAPARSTPTTTATASAREPAPSAASTTARPAGDLGFGSRK